MNAEGKTERILLVSDEEDEDEDLLQLMPESLRILTTAPSPGVGVCDAGETRLERLLFSHRQRQQMRKGTGRVTRPLNVNFKAKFKGVQEEPRLLSLQRDRRQGTGRVTRPLKITFKKPVLKSQSPAKPAEAPVSSNVAPGPEDNVKTTETTSLLKAVVATPALESPVCPPKAPTPATPATPPDPAEFARARANFHVEMPRALLAGDVCTPAATGHFFQDVAANDKSPGTFTPVAISKMSGERLQDAGTPVAAKLISPATLPLLSIEKILSPERRSRESTPGEKRLAAVEAELSLTKDLTTVTERKRRVSKRLSPESGVNRELTPVHKPDEPSVQLSKEKLSSRSRKHLAAVAPEFSVTKDLTPPECNVSKELSPESGVNRELTPVQKPDELRVSLSIEKRSSGRRSRQSASREQRLAAVEPEFSVTKDLTPPDLSPESGVNRELTPGQKPDELRASLSKEKRSSGRRSRQSASREQRLAAVEPEFSVTKDVSSPGCDAVSKGLSPESGVNTELTPDQKPDEMTQLECVHEMKTAQNVNDSSPAQEPESSVDDTGKDVAEMDDSNTDIEAIVEEVVADIQSSPEVEKEDSQPASVLENERMENAKAPVTDLSPVTPHHLETHGEEEPQPEVAHVEDEKMENADEQVAAPSPRTPCLRKNADDEPRKKRKRQTEAQSPWLNEAGMEWKDGRRCSRRIKSRPLEYWRGERLLYGRVHKTMTTLIGVKHASSPLAPKPKRGEKPKVFKVESFVPEQYEHLVKLAAI